MELWLELGPRLLGACVPTSKSSLLLLRSVFTTSHAFSASTVVNVLLSFISHLFVSQSRPKPLLKSSLVYETLPRFLLHHVYRHDRRQLAHIVSVRHQFAQDLAINQELPSRTHVTEAICT